MDQQLSIETTTTLNLTSASNTLTIPLNGARRILLSAVGLTGSGAELHVNGSNDNGATFPDAQSVGTNNVDLWSAGNTPVTINGDYLLLTGRFTHVRIYVFQVGNGTATLSATALPVTEMMAYYPAMEAFLCRNPAFLCSLD